MFVCSLCRSYGHFIFPHSVYVASRYVQNSRAIKPTPPSHRVGGHRGSARTVQFLYHCSRHHHDEFSPSAEKTDVILSASVAFDELCAQSSPVIAPPRSACTPTMWRVCRGFSATFTNAWKLQQENCEAHYVCDYISAGGETAGAAVTSCSFNCRGMIIPCENSLYELAS